MFFTPLLAGGVILTNASEKVEVSWFNITPAEGITFSDSVSDTNSTATSETTVLVAGGGSSDTNSTATSETTVLVAGGVSSDTNSTTTTETPALVAIGSRADTNSTTTTETPALVAVSSRADTNSTATSETASRVTTSSVSETASTTTAAPTPISETWAGSGTINGKTPTSGGGTWIASPEMVYSGGIAYPNGSFNTFAFHSVVRTDAEITAVIYPGGVGPNLSVPYRIYGRADTTLYPGSFYAVEFNDVNAQYNIRLFSNTGDLASAVTGIPSYGKTATLRINGSSIKVILGGVTIFDVTDTSVTGPGYFGFQIVYNEYGEEIGESTSGPISITPLAVSSVEATATLIASASRADTNSTASLETPALVAGAVSNDTNSTSTSEEADVFSSTLENVTDTNSVSDSVVTANNIFTGTPSDTTATSTTQQSNVQYVVAISDTTSTADTAVSANNILVAARLETAVSTATTETNTVVAGAILSETAVITSSENSTAIFSASRAETNSSSTSESAGFLASAAVNETNTTASSESSILTAGAAVSESVSTATTENVTANLSVTATDTTTTSTSDIGGIVIPVSISDTNSSSDSATATQSLFVSFNETTTTSSSESFNVVFIAAISEQAQANDSITAGVVSLRAVTDSNGIVSAQSSFIDAGGFLSDSIASSTIEAVLVSFLVNYTETTTTSSNDFGGIDLSNIDIYDYIIGTDGTDSTILYKPTTGVKLVAEEDSLRKLSANDPLSNKIKTTVIGDYPARRLSATTPQKKYIKVN